MANPTAPNRFKFDFRIFSILLLLAAIPLSLGNWLIFRSYEDAYLQMVGTQLGEAAEMAFSSLDSYLQKQIISTAGLAEVPAIREAVRRGNLDLTKNLDVVRRAIPEMEASWPSLDAQSPQLKAILDNPASDFLRRYISVEKAYGEIMVTDFLGRLVAASGKTTDYYQADEDWWKETYGDGKRGMVHVGDVIYDESTRAYSMDLAQPLVAGEEGVVGVIKVVLDVQDIHRLIGSFRAGPSATAALIRARGDVISAPGYSILDTRPYAALPEILGALEKQRRYLISTTSQSAVYGLTQRSFQELYPHLDWIVITSGSLADVLGPLPAHRRYFILLLAIVLLLTLIATLLLSREQSRPALEQDPHLDSL